MLKIAANSLKDSSTRSLQIIPTANTCVIAGHHNCGDTRIPSVVDGMKICTVFIFCLNDQNFANHIGWNIHLAIHKGVYRLKQRHAMYFYRTRRGDHGAVRCLQATFI